MSDFKWVSLSNALSVIAGSACVLGATYITKNANCLWALLIVTFFVQSFKTTNNDDDVNKN